MQGQLGPAGLCPSPHLRLGCEPLWLGNGGARTPQGAAQEGHDPSETFEPVEDDEEKREASNDPFEAELKALKADVEGDIQIQDWTAFVKAQYREREKLDGTGDVWLQEFLERLRRGAEPEPVESDESEEMLPIPSSPVTMLNLLVN